MALTDQVIMPGSDYQAICDATRALTGKTEVLKSGDIVTKLNNFPILLFNETLTLPTTKTTYAVSFKTFSGEECSAMTILDGRVLIFEGYGEVYIANQGWVIDASFRRITLLSTPTEEFLTWLNANVTKYTTPFLISEQNETITSAISDTIFTPSPPYDALSRVNVHIDYQNPIVWLSMASGNQVINTSGSGHKFMREVTVQKPSTLIPSNIKKGVDIGGVVGTLESGGGSTSETWVLKAELAIPDDHVSYPVDATMYSNNYQRDVNVVQIDMASEHLTFFVLNDDNNRDSVNGYAYGEWYDNSYRKLVFNVPPTGDLLTWLTANGVKQPANLAVQSSKDVTITSNGTTEITPDAPYDALKKVNLTANVVADVPLVTVTFKATKYGEEINSVGDDELAEMQRIVISALVGGNISLESMWYFAQQWGGMVFPFDVAVPQGSSVTICYNANFGGGVSATNALVANINADGIKSVYTIYNITDGATITIDVS